MGQVKTHTRKLKSGKIITVRAHKRGGDSVKQEPRSYVMKGSELAAYRATRPDYTYLGDDEAIKKAKERGFHTTKSGHIIYYDKDAKDFYINPDMKTHVGMNPTKPKVDKHRSGESRMYFRRNKLHHFQSVIGK